MKRRNFPSTLVGVPLAAMSRGALAVPTQHWDRILVLVELNGGNDGFEHGHSLCGSDLLPATPDPGDQPR